MNLQKRLQARMRQLISSRARLLCAVSGGPDSVVLAHLLKQASFPLVLGHVDHGIRKNSSQDARFVAGLAKRWQLPYETVRVSVPAHAARASLGLEEAARELRYKALLKMAHAAGCTAVVTAHTADDQAETVLMNFLRGAGPTGLAGIPPVRDLAPGVRLLRPLLNTSRQEVLAYAQVEGLAFRIDPTNRSLRFTRNRIRNRLLPLLEKEQPGLKQRLVQMGDIFREEQSLWAQNIQREFNKTVRYNNKKITVDLTRLLGYHRALGRRILRHLLTGISFQDTERVFHLALSPMGNLPVQLSGGLRVERKGSELIIRSRGIHE
jgi:tRNA(Ile)-lysidine synthase